MNKGDKWLKLVRAVFIPADEHKHSLKDETKQFIGKEFTWQYVWICDEDTMFPGVWALTVYDHNEGDPLCWVPEFDLNITEVL